MSNYTSEIEYSQVLQINVNYTCGKTPKSIHTTYISTQGNNKVLHIRLREEAHDKELQHELQYNPHKIISILSVFFYPTILSNFIIKFYILYPSIFKIIYLNEISYLKTL